MLPVRTVTANKELVERHSFEGGQLCTFRHCGEATPAQDPSIHIVLLYLQTILVHGRWYGSTGVKLKARGITVLVVAVRTKQLLLCY